LLIARSILLRERHRVLKRRYKEAIQEREAIAASTATHGINSRSEFMALSQSFGQDVHDLIEERMPAAEAILEEIVQGHTFPSPTETTTDSSTADTIPRRREAEARTPNGMAINSTFAQSQRNEDVGEAENTSDTESSEGSISTRGVVGMTEEPEMRRSPHESRHSSVSNGEDALQETVVEIAEIDPSQQEELSVDSQAVVEESDIQDENPKQHPHSRRQPYRMVNCEGKLVVEPWDRPGQGGSPSVGSR
jgi:hypothetical protein